MSYVYVIGAINRNSGTPDEIECIKIGVSNSPIERLATLQTGNHRELKLIYTLRTGKSVWSYEFEKHLHELLVNYRSSGEWFYCKGNNVFRFISSVFNSRIDETCYNWHSLPFYEEVCA